MISKIQYWLRKKRIFIPIIFLFVYKSIFNSCTGQFVLDKTFSAIAEDGRLIANVETFSLFYGLDITDIQLLSGSKFQKSEIFSAKRISIRYNLPMVVFLRLSVSEISLIDAKITLIQENGFWNFQEVFPPSQTKETEILTEAEPESNDTAFWIGVPISAYAKLLLKDVSFQYIRRDVSQPLDIGWKNLNLLVDIDTNRFVKIPYNLDALDIIDSLILELNPSASIPVWYKDTKISYDAPLDLKLLVHTDSKANPFFLQSFLQVGGDKLTIHRSNRPPINVQLKIDYDLKYYPDQDQIVLKDFNCIFQGKNWFKISGEIKSPLSKDRFVDLKLSESEIQLEPLSKVLEELPIPNMKLGGEIQLSPLSLQGAFHNLNITWQPKIQNFYFSHSGKTHSSKYLNLNANSILDLVTRQNPTAEKPLPIIKQLHIETLNADYNGILAHVTGSLGSDIPIDVQVNLDKLELNGFVKNISGLLKADLKITGKNFSSLSTHLDGYLSSFRFTLGRGRSGNSFFKINTSANLLFKEPFELAEISLPNLSLTGKNANGAEAFGLKANTKLILGENIIVDLFSSNITTNLAHLSLILPLSLKEKVSPVEFALGQKLSLGLKGHFDINNGDYSGRLNLQVPGLELNDMVADFAVKMPSNDSANINLSKFTIRAFSGMVGLDASGILDKRKTEKDPPLGPFFGDLKLKIFLKSAMDHYVAKGFSYRGEMYMDLKVKDYDITGDFISNNSKIVYNNGSCPGKSCKLLLVDSLNADIPVHHDLSIKKTNGLIEGDKSRFIKTYGRVPRDNFTIQQVLGSHPSIEGAPFAYVKSSGSYPGLTSRIQYKENFLLIDGLKLSLLDGMVYGKDFIINVGSGDLEKMEYMGTMQVRDIDLRQLLSKDAQSKIDDGKIKADLNLSGTNLADPIPNINLFFSIFQIGRDFGKSAMNVISTKGAIMDFIIDSYAVDTVDVELSKGLVYADVQFKKSLLSYVVNLEDSKISQKRMPLANFLKRAGSEISTYK
jgi:hypothetical protein